MKPVPDYSKCCRAPVLGNTTSNRLYCFKCRKTVRSFDGRKRQQAIDAIQFTRSRCMVQAMLFGQVIGYARDVPNLVHDGRGWKKVGRSSYKFFIHGSSLVEALGLWNPAEYDFVSLKKAEQALMDRIRKKADG